MSYSPELCHIGNETCLQEVFSLSLRISTAEFQKSKAPTCNQNSFFWQKLLLASKLSVSVKGSVP